METTWNDSLESFLNPVIIGNKKKSNANGSTMYCKSKSFDFSIVLTNDQITLNAYHTMNNSFIVARYNIYSKETKFSNNIENAENSKAKEIFSYIVSFIKGEIKELPKKFKL